MSLPHPGGQVPAGSGDAGTSRDAGGPRAGVALLLSLSMAQFMVVLDFTIVNVALPSIQRDLHVATTTLQWVISGYAVAFGGFLLLGGRLADAYGPARVYRIGLGGVPSGEYLRGPGRRAGAADHVPGGAGDGCGDAGARGPVPAGHQLAWGQGTRPRAGHLWRDRLGGLRVRRGARRPAG